MIQIVNVGKELSKLFQLIFNLLLVDVLFHLGLFGFFLCSIIGVVFVILTLYNLIVAMCKTTTMLLGFFHLPRLEIGDSKPRLEP